MSPRTPPKRQPPEADPPIGASARIGATLVGPGLHAVLTPAALSALRDHGAVLPNAVHLLHDTAGAARATRSFRDTTVTVLRDADATIIAAAEDFASAA